MLLITRLLFPTAIYLQWGDNRNLSKDSRHPEIGLIPEDNVVGKVIFGFSIRKIRRN